MYTVKNREEFISDIRSLDNKLSKIRLSSIEIDRKGKSIKYCFIIDTVIDDDLKNKILEEVEKIVPPIFSSVEISVQKVVGDDQLVGNEIFKFLNSNFPSVSIFIKPTDIRSTVVGDIIKYTIRLREADTEYFVKGGVMSKLNEYLATKFCSDFVGSVETKEVEESVSLLSEEIYESQLRKIEYRTIKVKDIVVVDDATIGDTAFYIEDLEEGDAVVCGRVTEITEKTTKNGKPFFIIHIDDTTGRVGGVYFTRKSTCQKIRDITVGESIIARGNLGSYNGKPSFTFNKINRCTFPENFVKKDKFKRSAPKNYTLIHPSKPEIVKYNSVFDDESNLPKELTQNTFVVFDLETTGLDVMNNGITEIGAVKIINGEIAEQFTTLIKPDYLITQEVIDVTGITEEMLKNSPKISAVLPDFMKFIEGSTLVAHNSDFDVKFIKRFASVEDFEIKNPVLDTMDLSREVVKTIKRFDLKTIADYFGIVFHHHRALSDAYATAEIFIKLMKLKYN